MLWLVVEESLGLWISAGRSDYKAVPWEAARLTFLFLLKWAEDLPAECVRSDHSPHHVLLLQ